MSKSHDYAWAAGFIDGEGWITIQTRSAEAKSGVRYYGHYLRLGVNHVRPEPLIALQRLFGGTLRRTTRVHGNRKPRHTWQVSCSTAEKALLMLLPYLRNKESEARIALHFQGTVDKAVSLEDREGQWEYRQWLKRLLAAVNSIG